jgi:hypothetical protein
MFEDFQEPNNISLSGIISDGYAAELADAINPYFDITESQFQILSLEIARSTTI